MIIFVFEVLVEFRCEILAKCRKITHGPVRSHEMISRGPRRRRIRAVGIRNA